MGSRSRRSGFTISGLAADANGAVDGVGDTSASVAVEVDGGAMTSTVLSHDKIKSLKNHKSLIQYRMNTKII